MSTRWPPSVSTRAAPASTCRYPVRRLRQFPSTDLERYPPHRRAGSADIGSHHDKPKKLSQRRVLGVVERELVSIGPSPIAQSSVVGIPNIDEVPCDSTAFIRLCRIELVSEHQSAQRAANLYIDQVWGVHRRRTMPGQRL